MRYQYVVILKKHGERATNLLSILLCLFSALSFSFFAIQSIHNASLNSGTGTGLNSGAATGPNSSTGTGPNSGTGTGRNTNTGTGLNSSAGSNFLTGGPSDAWLALGVAAVLLIGLALSRLARGRIRAGKWRYRHLLFLAAAGWLLLTHVPWVGAFFFILTFLEYQTKRPLEIGFDHDRVVINTLVKQRFDWTAFNNVILKDGLLTLDFKSNRLIQKEVADDDDDDDADEEEFNLYCRGRLAAVAANGLQP
jgi:hypothetical protein